MTRTTHAALLGTLALFAPMWGCSSTATSDLCPICGLDHEHTAATADHLRAEDVDWTPLNPARGDKSPQAANLWGDRAQDGATGFLVKFVDGFSSPPHIHNVTYRGVVLAGEVHNDDPDAATMWMPAGSFWTQPAGEVHITAARGTTNIAYIEIDSGPYLVHPPEEAFDEGERPVNVHDSNMVWVSDDHLVWIPQRLGVDIAFLWGSPDDPNPYGLMVRIPRGFDGTIHHDNGPFRAIVVDGSVSHLDTQTDQPVRLVSGSYLGSGSEGTGATAFSSDTGAVLYVRARSELVITGE